MNELDEGQKAFSTFSVLNGGTDTVERDQLFRNMAQLFAFVSSRCDDEQVEQYDQVLTKLADMVDTDARSHVARLLAPLDRAPGMVVAKLAHDIIEVAQPLLEFSNVLSDDDLIEIIAHRAEAHRVAIAGRSQVADRVGEAIAIHGDGPSLHTLIENSGAEMGDATLRRLVVRAATDPVVASDLKGRSDVDLASLRAELEAEGTRRLNPPQPATAYARTRNRASFSASEWKLAYNQIKALADRRQLDDKALARFARFGYGHHAAAALSVMMPVAPEVLVKWLAMQDYVAITVALRALGIEPEMFSDLIATLPWRDVPTDQDKLHIRRRYEALTREEASDIFELWRAHAFRKRSVAA